MQTNMAVMDTAGHAIRFQGLMQYILHLQGFIQKILFGVEGGVALSHTVAPHEYIMCSYTILVIIREILLTYIIIPKYMLSPISLSLSLSLSLFLSLSLSPFSLSFSFSFGGEVGQFGGEASPPAPPSR